MTRFIFFLIMSFALHDSFAFVPTPQEGRHIAVYSSGGTTTARFLHPDQAKELEQCAYDFLKQAIEEETEAALMTTPHKVGVQVKRQQSGPFAWCLQHLPKNRWLVATKSSADEGLKP